MPTSPSRTTRQRIAISSELDGAAAFLSAQELHDRLRRRGESIGLATVYRNLQAMARRGEIDVVRREDGEALFRRCARDSHHHHLVCRHCGRSVELHNDEVERWARSVAAGHGFSHVSHDLELFGSCADCSAYGSG